MAKETDRIVKAYKSDVSSKDTIAGTVDQIVKDFGKLDIMVANAGIATHHDGLEYSVEQWQEIMKINLDGAFYTAQAAGSVFKKQGSGNLIFTASVSAILVNVPQRQSAYNASKAAVVHLAKCLAVEWTDFARVNCVSPGFIDTDSQFGDLMVPCVADSDIVLSVHPDEWRKKWFDMIPAQRLCDPYELKGVSPETYNERMAMC